MHDQRAEVSLSIAPDERYESTPVDPPDFRILVLGDLSARGESGTPTSESPRRVDRDNVDAHLARIAPRLRIDVANGSVDLAFASMDDFHPDRLVARLSALATPSAALDTSPIRSNVASSSTASPDLARAVSGASLLDDMLDDVIPQPRRSDELSAFVERAVAPHLVRPPDAATVAREQANETETAGLLRQVLHHPRVQALEATWRAIEMLVRRLDTDGELHLFMLDVARDQVAAAIERLARERDAASPESWALVISLHAWPDGDAGAEQLAAVAMAARGLGTPVVTGAPASFAGRKSAVELDDETFPADSPEVYTLIRRSLEARFLGLTFPRVLLRVPYGRENPCDTIEFEELEDPERHDEYLWGSGAAAVAVLVGEAFNAHGWAIGPRMSLDLSSLPLFTYRRGPETVAMSCAETIMSERNARHLLARGLMPLAWIKNTDRVRLVEVRSVAEPGATLATSWAGPTSGSRV